MTFSRTHESASGFFIGTKRATTEDTEDTSFDRLRMSAHGELACPRRVAVEPRVPCVSVVESVIQRPMRASSLSARARVAG